MSGAPKHDRLAAVADRFAVPAMGLVEEPLLKALIPGLPAAMARLAELTAEIARTKACFLDEHLQEIAAVLQPLSPAGPEAVAAYLGPWMQRIFGPDWQNGRYAIRSAGRSEDSAARSFAGLYESHLEISAEDLAGAILSVWRSAFGKAALLERLAAGASAAAETNPMAVIVQRMVAAQVSGVAFSADPLGQGRAVIIECVAGLGDRLMDGTLIPEHATLERAQADAAGTLFQRCAALALGAEEALGQPADIEWAFDGETLWLLQLRPITTGPRRGRAKGVDLDWADLYGEDEAAIAALGPLPEFASYFRAKRKRIADFAGRHGLAKGAALIVRASRAGLHGPRVAAMMARFSSPTLVIDLNDNLRQMLIPRDVAPARIAELLGPEEEGVCLVLRDFVQGDFGMITEARPDGAVFGEWSAEGLLAINRGTARTQRFRLTPEDSAEGDLPPLDTGAHKALARATRAAQGEIGPIRIEWVSAPQGLMPVDFSNAAAALGQRPPDLKGETVAHGYARAPLLQIGGDDRLRRISVAASVSLNDIPEADQMGSWFEEYVRAAKAAAAPPIVVVDRPYAALAALIPHVSGFVFESASVLCHLAILLRENARPALQSPALFSAAEAAAPGTLAEIDTRGNGLTIWPRGTGGRPAATEPSRKTTP
jgi:hypothetical protein